MFIFIWWSIFRRKSGQFSRGKNNIRPYLKKIWYANYSGGSSADVLTLKVNKNFDSNFIYYTLFQDKFFEHMMHGAKGTKMPRGDKYQILNFPIPDFPISTQKSIAKFLSALDAKIELNNKINRELESMAKTLYDYWFVQFDFPNEQGKPYKSSGGKMGYNSELKRKIPEGWKVKTLNEMSSFISRGISPVYIEENGICVLNQKCIRNRTVLYNEARQHDNTKRNAETKRINLFDVLVNSTGVGTLGRVAIVNWLYDDFVTVDSHVTIVRADEELINKFFFGFSLLEKQQDIEQFANGSTGQVELNRSQLESLKLIVPTNDIQSRFGVIYKNYLDKMAVNLIQNLQLSELRDWLLPMLMNGQVTVKENNQRRI